MSNTKLRKVRLADVPLRLRQKAFHELLRQGVDDPETLAVAAFWPSDTQYVISDKAYREALKRAA